MVVLLCIDGARPDGLERAATPNLDRIKREGSTSLTVRPVSPNLPLAGQQSLFRGVTPDLHGAKGAELNGFKRTIPSLIDLIAAADKKVGMFYTIPSLREVCLPDSAAVNYCNARTHTSEGDLHIVEMAIRTAAMEDFDFVFLNLGHAGYIGANYGWHSDEYIQALTASDNCIGKFTDAIIALHQPVDFVIVSNHSGANAQGPDDLPAYFYGYRMVPGQLLEEDISLLDFAPTIATLLGVTIPRDWQGKLVNAAINLNPQAHRRHTTVFGLED
jgi:predicted AlkP superfamily pyrophosphatase or phosphodiesterase